MTERTNAAMRRLLAEVESGPLDPELQSLLDAGFQERDGSVFLAAEVDPGGTGALGLDRTGIEALTNHVHIADRLDDRDHAHVVEQGHRYAIALADRLSGIYPAVAFQVVMSVSDDCVVRFYAKRSAQPWLVDDVESYRDEALLVLDVAEPASPK